MADDAPSKKPFYKKWWVWLLGFFLLIIILSASSDAPPNNTQNGEAQNSDTTTQEAQFKLSVGQIMDEYENNEVAADAKYENNIVEISGIIDSIDTEITGKPYVVINSGGDFELFGVQCVFGRGQENLLLDLSKGESITLKGKVSGKLGNVLLEDCQIVE